MKIRLGIISDLHCHSLENHKDKRRESRILTDVPTTLLQDPYLSLKKLINETPDYFNVDVLVAPGDYSNKCCPDGIIKGWEIIKSSADLMKAKSIIATVGNHDVDSRKKYNDDSFYYIRKLDSEFPTLDLLKNEFFWNNGYLITEFDGFRILNVNTVHNHINKEEAEHGLISDEALSLLEVDLQGFDDSKLGIAVCHHNPIEHSRVGSKNIDFMYKGDELIQLLDKYGFEFIIHGHKHDPMIRYALGSGDSSIIFSAGSFSGVQDILLPGGLNTFHLIDIEIKENARSFGKIETWFFIPTKGWKKDIPNPYIKSNIGFGARFDIKELAQNIYEWFLGSIRKQFYYKREFLLQFEMINYLIPIDVEKLHLELRKRNILISEGDINDETKIESK